MARLRSLDDEQTTETDSADPELDSALDRLTAEVTELEAQRALALSRPDTGTVEELESKATSIQVR